MILSGVEDMGSKAFVVSTCKFGQSWVVVKRETVGPMTSLTSRVDITKLDTTFLQPIHYIILDIIFIDE